MDENKLLDECVDIKLTPLQTLILSKTVISINSLVSFLAEHDIIHIEKVNKDEELAPDSEQIGSILLQSALTALNEVSEKIWESGKEQFGESVPEEFRGTVGVYATILEEITTEFVQMLYGKGDK